MRAAGHTSVMQDRARGEVEGDSDQAALWRRLEYFPTPPWAGRALGEILAELDPPQRDGWWAWEPACGEGHLAHALGPYFAQVYATDIHAHGGPLQRGDPLDFLSPAADGIDQIDWVVTNPPFAKAAEFVEAGLRRARRGVAILARTTLLSSAGRYPLFFPAQSVRGGVALTAIAPFFERVPMVLGRYDPKASTATDYAWFIWMKPPASGLGRQGEHALAARPMVWPIGPGTKARLTQPEDLRTWAAEAPAPLFEGAADE